MSFVHRVSLGLWLILGCLCVPFSTRSSKPRRDLPPPPPPPPSSGSPPRGCLPEPAGLIKPKMGAHKLITLCPLAPAACFQFLEACISARGGRGHTHPAGIQQCLVLGFFRFFAAAQVPPAKTTQNLPYKIPQGLHLHFDRYRTPKSAVKELITSII